MKESRQYHRIHNTHNPKCRKLLVFNKPSFLPIFNSLPKQAQRNANVHDWLILYIHVCTCLLADTHGWRQMQSLLKLGHGESQGWNEKGRKTPEAYPSNSTFACLADTSFLICIRSCLTKSCWSTGRKKMVLT